MTDQKAGASNAPQKTRLGKRCTGSSARDAENRSRKKCVCGGHQGKRGKKKKVRRG